MATCGGQSVANLRAGGDNIGLKHVSSLGQVGGCGGTEISFPPHRIPHEGHNLYKGIIFISTVLVCCNLFQSL